MTTIEVERVESAAVQIDAKEQSESDLTNYFEILILLVFERVAAEIKAPVLFVQHKYVAMITGALGRERLNVRHDLVTL